VRHDLLREAEQLHGAGDVNEVAGRIFRVRASGEEYTVTRGEDARWSCSCPGDRECIHMYAAARVVMLEDPDEHAAVERLWEGLG
jgi:hypothetical protein